MGLNRITPFLFKICRIVYWTKYYFFTLLQKFYPGTLNHKCDNLSSLINLISRKTPLFIYIETKALEQFNSITEAASKALFIAYTYTIRLISDSCSTTLFYLQQTDKLWSIFGTAFYWTYQKKERDHWLYQKYLSPLQLAFQLVPTTAISTFMDQRALLATIAMCWCKCI